MRKMLWILYQPYKYLIYMPFVALSTFVCGGMAFLFAAYINKKLGSLWGVVWARVNAFMTPMFVEVIGRENLDKTKSYVITANHPSHFDIFVMYGWIGVDFKWTMKQELRKVPFLGASCEKIGHIYVDRSRPEKAIASINAAKGLIKKGTSAIFFPEGTRGAFTPERPFKKGAFKFAIDMGFPILPVSIVGTGRILPPHTLDLFPGKVKMIIHKQIDTAGYNDDNIQELIDRVRAVVKSGLGLDAR
jgi:1-acyl-sn-glycerol-3-phosphate acyltransferase